MITLDTLRAFGANVDEGLARCLNNEQFYLRLVNRSIENDGFGKLSAAVDANDAKAVFEISHKLKGVLANLAITPILEPVSELCELARKETPGDYRAYVDTILAKLGELKAMG